MHQEIRHADLLELMPIIPGIIWSFTGRDPGLLGIYGPTMKNSYTYHSTPVDPRDYIDEGDTLVQYPEEGTRTVHLNEILRKGWVEVGSIASPVPIHSAAEWGSSMAWVECGSWAMIYLNVRARQAAGLICPTKYHQARDSLSKIIGRKLPDATIIYPEGRWNCTGVPPDLMVKWTGYRFSDLVGTGALIT